MYLWSWSEIHQLEANARPRSLSPFSCVFCASCQQQPVASGLSFARSMTWPTVCQRPHANTFLPNKSRASCLSTPCLLCSLRLLLFCCSFCRFFIATWPRCQEDRRQHLKCQKALCVGGSRPLIKPHHQGRKQHIPALPGPYTCGLGVRLLLIRAKEPESFFLRLLRLLPASACGK